MDGFSLNWAAIIVCTLLNMIVGAIWYNPKTFFPIWWKALGKTDTDVPGKGGMAIVWILTVVSAAVQAGFMAIAVAAAEKATGGATLASGALTGLVVAVGIVAPTYLVNNLFADRGFKVWAIEVGNHLVDLVVMGAVFGAWHT